MQCSDGLGQGYADRVRWTSPAPYKGAAEERSLRSLARHKCAGAAAMDARTRGGPFFMQFEASRLSAKLGCNGLGADYTQSANVLDPGPLIGTKMACPDMSFETQGGTILGQPMTMNWNGGDRLSLSNPAGRIELTRSY